MHDTVTQLPASSGGASVTALASPVTTETKPECTPTDETEPSAPPKTDDVIQDDVMHLLSTAVTSCNTESGSGVDGTMGEMKLRSDDEQLDKQSLQKSRNRKEMESQGESMELQDKETASSDSEERVSQMEEKQIETATERDVLLHSSDGGISSGPGMEQRPSGVERGQIGVDRRQVSTEQKPEVGVERSNLGLGVIGMEQRQTGMEGGPAQVTVISVTNEATDITVTEKAENLEEEESEQYSDLLATAQPSVDKALTQPVSLPVVETPTVASSTSTVVVETNTTVATETPELPREIAMAADTAYPSLSTLMYAAEEEEEEDLIPFSEQDLGLLYQNRQLDAREDTEEAFIRNSWQEHHRLYELLSLYQKSLLALSTAKAHLQVQSNLF